MLQIYGHAMYQCKQGLFRYMYISKFERLLQHGLIKPEQSLKFSIATCSYGMYIDMFWQWKHYLGKKKNNLICKLKDVSLLLIIF